MNNPFTRVSWREIVEQVIDMLLKNQQYIFKIFKCVLEKVGKRCLKKKIWKSERLKLSWKKYKCGRDSDLKTTTEKQIAEAKFCCWNYIYQFHNI